MRVILVANPKGGSGKTTLSVNLAGYLASQGERVELLDMDRQKSATHWLAMRDAATRNRPRARCANGAG
jgi:chromosome partitioning protein